MRPGRLAATAMLVAGALEWSEWLHWRASSRRTGSRMRVPGRQAILVLGWKNPGSRANHINRYRVRVALRSIDPRARETVLVFSGGPVRGRTPEADLLLWESQRRGYAGLYIIERNSRTTRENIRNTVERLSSFDTVKIASNSLYAERARAYLWALRPDVGERLVAADDYRWGETPFVKLIAAAIDVTTALRRSRRRRLAPSV